MFEKIPDQVGTLNRVMLAEIFDNRQLTAEVNNEIRELINNTPYRQYNMRNSTRNAEDLIKRADITLSLKLLEEIAIEQIQLNYIGTNITNMVAGTIYDTTEDLTTLSDNEQKHLIQTMLNTGWCTSVMGSASYKKALIFNNVIKGASFLNKFKKLDITKGNTDDLTFERMKNLELDLMENRFDNTIVVKVTNTVRNTEFIVVLTNRHTWKKVRKMTSKIIDLYPNIIPEAVDETFFNKIKFLFEKLGTTTTNDNTAWQETFIATTQDPERTKQKAIMELEKLLEYTRNDRMNEIKRNINSLKQSIAQYEDKIRNCYEEARISEGQLLRLEDDPELKGKVLEALEYAQKSKLITKMNIRAQEKCLRILVDAPIRYFDPEYAKALYKNLRTDTDIVKKGDRKVFKQLFKELFIDDKYTLYCSTEIDVYLYCGRSSSRPVDFSVNRKTEDELTYLAQPHLNGYACFGNNKIEAYKACEKYDLLGLLTVFTTSAQNFNLTDSTVFSYFRDQIAHYGAAKKTIKNNETGEMFSFNEYYYNNVEDTYKSPKTKITKARYERELTDEEITHLLKALRALKRIIIKPLPGLQLVKRLYEINATTSGDAGLGNFYINADNQNKTIQLMYDDESSIVYASKGSQEYYDFYDNAIFEGSDTASYCYTELLDEYHNTTETNEEKPNEEEPVISRDRIDTVIEEVANVTAEMPMPF